MTLSLYYFSIFIGTVLFCVGMVFFLKKPFNYLAISAAKQLDILLTKTLSEEEKDRQILRNLTSLLKWLFLSIFLLSIVIVCGVLPTVIHLQYYPNIEADTSSVYFYISMIIGSFALFFFRNKDDYSYWSKILHTIILDNYAIGIYLFKREIKKYSKNETYPEGKPFIIVTGLARAGTTALTNLLYDKQNFHSINYSNVPFLMAPNTWKKIYNSKKSRKRERAHGDQVQFDENSIEALEEYFFKAHFDDQYITTNTLEVHDVNEEILRKYYTYQDLFKSREDTYYLAKNNNFILRYNSLRKQNKSFKMIVVFRNPLDHAKSILKQHENFIKKQTEDSFVLDYMNWLGHYEFGLNQKHFDFDGEELFLKYDKTTLPYWLGIWLNYYSYIITLENWDNIYLVDYNDLLNKPKKLKETLAREFDVEMVDRQLPEYKSKNNKKKVDDVEDVLLKRVMATYDILLEKKFQIE